MLMRFGLVMSIGLLAGVASAQRVDAVFDQNCASCHEVGNAARPANAPDRKALRKLTPEAVYESISNGSMKDRAQNLSDAQRQAIAEYLGGRRMGTVAAGDAARMSNRCVENPALGDIDANPSWNGWSADGANTRFQKSAGIPTGEVPRLKLKWSFGLPGATYVYGQPSVVAGRLFAAGDTGYVY